MVELFLLTLLIILIVLSIRRGKPVVLDNPLIIQRPGQYHITLAPQLDRAQTFIEQIAARFSLSHPPNGHGSNATPDDETCHARFPLPNPLPQAGEGANESLREFFVKGELPSRFFEVRDPGVLAREGGSYLLAAAYRSGMLYFQAIDPQPLLRDSDSHLKQIREFSGAVLALHPLEHPADGDEAEKLRNAVETAAQQMNITVKTLADAD